MSTVGVQATIDGVGRPAAGAEGVGGSCGANRVAAKIHGAAAQPTREVKRGVVPATVAGLRNAERGCVLHIDRHRRKRRVIQNGGIGIQNQGALLDRVGVGNIRQVAR